MLAPRGIRRILLVTSAMHMPRAAGAFRKAGFEIVAVPADFHSGWDEPLLLEKWLPSADNLRNSELALREWLGIAVPPAGLDVSCLRPDEATAKRIAPRPARLLMATSYCAGLRSQASAEPRECGLFRAINYLANRRKTAMLVDCVTGRGL